MNTLPKESPAATDDGPRVPEYPGQIILCADGRWRAIADGDQIDIDVTESFRFILEQVAGKAAVEEFTESVDRNSVFYPFEAEGPLETLDSLAKEEGIDPADIAEARAFWAALDADVPLRKDLVELNWCYELRALARRLNLAELPRTVQPIRCEGRRWVTDEDIIEYIVPAAAPHSELAARFLKAWNHIWSEPENLEA